VRVNPQPELTFTNNVLAVVPSTPVLPSQRFTVPVYGHATYSISAFSVLCQVGENLAIEGVTTDTETWLVEVRPLNPTGVTEVGVVAILSDPEQALEVVRVEPELLFSLDVRVLLSALEGGFEPINCTTVFLSNIHNEKIQPQDVVTPTASLVVTAAGTIQPGVGEVSVARSLPRGLFSFAEQSQLVNMAVLDSEAVSVGLNHLVAMSSGRLVAAPTVTCISESRAFQLSPQCTQVILNGSETTGAAGDAISVVYQNFTSSVLIRVWYPTLPVPLQTSPDILRPIEGWLTLDSGGECRQQYQQATLDVLADFMYSAAESPVFTVSVLPHLSHLVNSSDPNVVTVSGDGLTLIAVSPGVSAISCGPSVTPSMVTVTNTSIAVSSLDVTLFSGLTLNLPPSPYAPLSTQLASISVEQTFASITTPIYVSLLLVLDGGHIHLLDQQDDSVLVTSLAPGVVEVSDGQVTPIGAGAGELIRVTLVSPCTGAIAAGNGSAEITTPNPLRLDVSQSSTLVTYPGDTASIGGVPTYLSLTVTLVFPDNLTRETTGDPLTAYNVLLGAGLVDLMVGESEILITPSDPNRLASGPVLIMVSYQDYPISTNVSFEVVTYRGIMLLSTPFPAYEGSSTINKSTLFQIESTGVFQQAALELNALLSDGSSVPVTQSSLAFYEAVPPSVSIVGTIISVTQPGTYQIQGQLGSSVSMIDLEVTSQPVSISALRNFSLSGVTDTFSGTQGSIATLNLGVTFSDATQYPGFIPDASGVFPRVLSLTVDTPSVVSINPLTGQVTLQNNHHSMVAITASTTGTTQLVAQTRFACNLQPAIGDVDLGMPGGIPVPSLLVGEMVSVPLVVNAGTQLLGRAQLTISYSIQTLGVVSVSQNSSWPGTLQHTNNAGIGLLSICADSASGLAGRVYLGTIDVMAVATGVGSIGGIVMRLHDTNGNSIGNGRLRRFVAGDVTVDILSPLRARRDAMVPHVQHRVRRNTQCAPPFPCTMCPQDNREMGDINGDCIFDSADVLHLLQYHAEDLFDFQLDTGSALLSSLIAAQEQQLDSDLNSALDVQDAYFLHGVQLGLLNFLRDVSVAPVQENSACLVAINATMMGGRGVAPDPALTTVFFDIALPFDPTFTSQRLLDESVVLVGSLVPTVDKGLALPGTVLQAGALDGGVYSVTLETNLTLDNIGISVIQVTSTAAGVDGTNQARTRAMLGFPDPPYAHPNPLTVSLPAFSDTVSVRASTGYNSLVSFNNTMSTLACITPPPPPVVDQPLVRAAVPENLPVGRVVANITAQSQSERSVVYSIAAGNVGGVFAVGSSSGMVSVVLALDREATDFYSLQILATDPASGFATSAVLEVTVTDVNDNPPVFAVFQPSLSIPANTPVGAIIAMVSAQDIDAATNAEVAYTLSGAVFAVDSDTGIITLRQVLDFDVDDSHLIVVVATDMGLPPLSSSIALNITVLPPDPTVLEFDEVVYNSSVPENSPDSLVLLQVMAAAVNQSETVQIQYTLESPTDAPFAVNASSGVLVVSGAIDRELTPSYALSVTAMVLNLPRTVPALAVVLLTVLDVNDNNPGFNRDQYTATVQEETPAGTLSLSVTAQDPDAGLNGTIRYSLAEASNSLSINANTGLLTNIQPLDREFAENITITVVSADLGVPALSSFTNVTIQVRDINDNAPSLLVTPAVVTINESVNIGSVVGVAEISDADSEELNGMLTLDVLSADTQLPAPEFAISSATGEITSSVRFDYEVTEEYSLLVIASDNGSPPLTSIQNFTVLIADLNDNPPEFQTDVFNVTIAENISTPSVVLELVAFDADSGLNADLVYSIASVRPPGNLFQLSPNGILQVVSPLDYEQTQMYEIVVMVANTAPGTGPDFATVYVEVTNVNEFPPMFSQDVYQAFVSEEVIGEHVVQVVVNDSDLGDNITLLVDSAEFRVGEDGVVVTAVALDRETISQYNITVLAMDDTVPLMTATTLIIVNVLDINDNNPVFGPFSNLSLLDSTLVGTTLLVLTASDADDAENGAIDAFVLLTPTEDFSLTADGQLSVSRPLDSGQVSSYLLTVLVGDNGAPPLNTTTVIAITISPSPLPIFEQSTYSATVRENNPEDTFLVQVRATPRNLDATATSYHLVLPSPLFAVDPESGNVTALVPLDREDTALHSITVEAEAELNSTSLVASTQVNITVLDENDNSPQFVSPFQAISIDETTPPGVVIAEFEAFDDDIGSNAVVEYSISSGNEELQLMVDDNGTVLTTSPILGALGLFNISILVSNPSEVGSLSSTAQLAVQVLPVNAFDPVFLMDLNTIILSEDTPIGTTIATILAVDSDFGSAGDLTYSLMPSVTTFDVDPMTGNITLAVSLDFEAVVNYTLILVGTDGGQPSRSANTSILILVTDSNDNPPVFSQTQYSGSLDENLPPGQSILTVDTSDEDTPPNALVTYDLLPSDSSVLFQVSPAGVLQNSMPLDREQLSSVALTIRALNNGSGVTLSSTTMAVVSVGDINDNTPTFSESDYSRILQAPISANMTVLTVIATDADSLSINSRITFSLLDPSDTFSINPDTGMVQSAAEIPNAGNFTFNVTATDAGSGMLSSQALVSVVVLPANDLTAGRERDFAFGVEQGISLRGASSEISPNEYQQLFGLAVGRDNRESRTVSASLGPLSATLRVTPVRLDPIRVTAVLVSGEVWPDGATVRVVVQVRDGTHNVHVQTSVTAQLTHATLGSARNTCTTRSSDGICTITVPVPGTWFQAPANATVEFGLNSNILQNLGSVAVQEQPMFEVGSDVYTYAEMPLREVFVGSAVSIPVYGRTGSKGVGSYTLTVQGSIHMAVLSLQEDSIWTAQTQTGSGGAITITAVLRDQATSPPAQQVLLFTIQARILGTSSLNMLIPAAITAAIVELSDFDRLRLLPSPSETGSVQSFFLSRNGVTRSGAVYVSGDSVVRILPYVTRAEFINTALLDGEVVMEPILVASVHRSGRVAVAGSTASTCSSEEPSVVAVTSNCSSIQLTSNQNRASLNTSVSITQGGITGSFPVQAWVPQAPLMLILSDQALEVFAGPETNCTTLRQTSSISAFTSFTNTEDVVPNIDVTAMVTSTLSSSSADTALLSGAMILARQAGLVTIQTSPLFPGIAFPSINISILDSSIDVLGLDVRVLTEIQASGTSVVSRTTTNRLLVTTVQDFDFEGTRGTAIATAVFSDGTRMLLDEAQVAFSSLAPNIVEVSGTSVTAVGSGSGELVEAVWTSPCNDTPIATGRAFVSVTIPRPTSVGVVLSTPRLSAPDSTASSIGVPTSATLTVTAQYEDGRMQDLTTDNRTIYSTPGNINLTIGGSTVTIATNTNASLMDGVFSITVAFSQFQGLTESVNYSIVSVADIALRAIPFPAYPGSSLRNVTRLSPVATSNPLVRQQAVILVTALLSSAETLDVSTETQLQLAHQASGTSLQDSATITRGRLNNVLSFDDASPSGNLTISATLRDITSSSSLRLDISSNPVQISSISITRFPDGNTLKGVVNVTHRQVIISVTFDDGSQYVNLFQVLTIPGLVTFQASPPSAVTVGADSGIATLRGNNPSLATITVQSLGSSVSQAFMFACNLDPGVGDVDLGSLTGLPLPPATTQSQFSVPVRVNSGTAVLDSMEFDITFDPTILRALSATRGPDWPASGQFQFTTNDPINIITIGGTLIGSGAVSGTTLHLATIQFEAVGTGLTGLSGIVHTLAESSASGVATNIGSVPRTFIAGSVQTTITGSRQRRSAPDIPSALPRSRVRRQSPSPCPSPPCAACTPRRETGDVDGNCVFDVRDVSFLQLHYLTTITTGVEPTIPQDRRGFLDADLNGQVDANDVVFMLRVNFRLLRFASLPEFQPVQSSGGDCTFAVNITLVANGDTPADNSTTALVFDVANENSTFQAIFDASNFTTGVVLPFSKGVGVYGGLVVAQYLQDGVYGIRAESALAATVLGVSPIQVTYDATGSTSASRRAAMFSSGAPIYGMLDATFALRGEAVSVNTQLGYSPLLMANSGISTEECLRLQSPLTFQNTPYTAVASEAANIGSFVLQVSAISTRPSPSIVYSIVRGMSEPPFALNSSTGVIVLSGSLDFESTQSHSFQIMATEITLDGETLTAVTTAVVTVSNANDLPPEVEPLVPSLILASRAIGEPVLQVSARDPDGLDSLMYNVSGGQGPDLFSIDNSGMVRIAASLLPSANTVVTLSVTVMDTVFSTSTQVVLSIFLPSFSQAVYSTNVSEAAAPGMAVAALTLINTGDEEFSLASQDPTFLVDTNGTLLTNRPLDYEAVQSYTIIVVANSTNIEVVTAVNISLLDENDNAPEFTEASYNVSISSSSSVGATLSQITAMDRDSPGPNSDVSYSISPANDSLAYLGISADAGDVMLLLSLFGGPSELEFVVTASDNGTPPLSTSVTLTVMVQSTGIPEFPLPPTVRTVGGVLALSGPTLQLNSSQVIYQQDVTKVASLFSGQLLASFPGSSIETSVALSSVVGVATSASPHLLHPTGTVYQDEGQVRLAVQVRDINYATRVSATSVGARAVLTSTNDLLVSSTPCTPDQSTGICVVTLSLPGNWFSGQGTALLLPTLNGDDITTPPVLLSLQPSPTVSTALSSGVLVECPARDVVSGGSVTLEVFGYSSFPISGFSLLFETSPQLSITALLIDTSQWSVETANSTGMFGLSAVSSSPELQTPSNGARVMLFSLRVLTSPGLAFPAVANVTAQVQSLSNTVEGSIILTSSGATSGPAQFLSRSGQGTSGVIHIAPNSMLALFPRTEQSELVNTAVLSGTTVSIPTQLLIGYASGDILPHTGVGVTCISSHPSVINPNRTCTALILSGGETAGSGQVAITYSIGSATGELLVRVYYPQSPLLYIPSDTNLNRVQYDEGCTQYQDATLSVFANFTAASSEHAIPNVRVTDLISPRFFSSNTSVVRVEGSMLRGMAPGSAIICTNGILTFGCTEVTVSDEIVEVSGLVGSVLVDVSIATRNTDLSVNMSGTASISPRSQFLFEQEQGSLLVAVQFTDGAISAVSSDEITIFTSNSSVYDVRGSVIVPVGSGEAVGSYLWQPLRGQCNFDIVDFFLVVSSLPSPTSLLTSPLPSPRLHALTTPTNPAALVGVSTSLPLTVTLVFEGGRTLPATSDPRVTITPGSDIITVSAGVVTATGSGSGDTRLLIQYQDDRITLNTTVDIVVLVSQGVAVLAYPFPNFPGSASITTLSPIENTGVWQRARLELSLSLSNGTTLDVTGLPNATLETNEISSVNAQLSPASILTVVQAGFVQVLGTFSTHTNDLLITVQNTPVTVSGAEIVPLATLRGVARMFSQQLSIDLTLSDGTLLLSYPTNPAFADQALPGLVTYGANSFAFSVSGSGMLQPLLNTHSPVTVNVRAGSSNIANTSSFVVNLDPDVGDMDIGSASGIAIPPGRVGQEAVFPVLINTGGRPLGSVDTLLMYDVSVIRPLEVTAGPGFMGGIHQASLNDPPGEIRFGGALSEDISGARLHIFSLRVRYIGVPSSGESSLQGSLLTLAERNFAGVAIGSPTPRSIIAGNVTFEVTGNGKRSAAQYLPSPSHSRQRRQAECPTPPCSCSGESLGDTDGNCVFDVRDVSFTLLYISQNLLTSSPGSQVEVTSAQLRQLDPNQDDTTDTSDAFFLLRAVFRLVYFLSGVEIVPVQDPTSQCLFTVQVQLAAAAGSTVGPVEVLVDFAFQSSSDAEEFSSSELIAGEVLTIEKGGALNGAVVLAQPTITSGGMFVVQLNSSFVSSDIGVSIIVVTFDAENATSASRSVQFLGLPPLRYPFPLLLNLTVRNSPVIVAALSGYSPFRTSSNVIPSTTCSPTPILESNLNVTFSSPFQAELTWMLFNMRMELDFSSDLTLVFSSCAVSQSRVILNSTCTGPTEVAVDSATSHTLQTTPFTGYYLQVRAPGSFTDHVGVVSPEATPSGVQFPELQVIENTLVFQWNLPDSPNGVITHYTLYLNSEAVYNGSALTFSLSLPVSLPLSYSLEAHNTAGTGSSGVGSISSLTPTGGLSLAVEEAIIITAVLTALLIVVLVGIMCCGMAKRRRGQKAKTKLAFLSSDFEAENIGVVRGWRGRGIPGWR
jgi:hypothetical protein